MPSVLVNEMPRSDEFKVRNATSRVARLRYATRDYLLHMLFLFSLPFSSPPSAREMALLMLHPHVEERRKHGESMGTDIVRH